MPIVSKKQWRYLGANEPGILHKFAHETKTPYSKLPEKVKKKKAKKKRKK